MELSMTGKIHALLQRELQEYRNSLVLTPIVISSLLLFLMLMSVLFAGRLSILGEGAMHLLLEEGDGAGVNISISIDEGEKRTGDAPADLPESSETEEPIQELVVVEDSAAVDEEEWDFSREWNFKPLRRHDRDVPHQHEILDMASLNPVLNGLHSLFLGIMFFLSINYLLGCLYQDRKDRSILFWKSLPVSEWQEVLAKLAVATLVVPLIYFAVSLVTQLFSVLIAMLMVWRMDGDATATVLGNVEFLPLILNQLGGIVVWALWMVPAYAWFMLASASARRSPFLLAFSIPLGLVFIEKVFLGSDWVLLAMGNHLPHMVDGNDAASLGFYVYGPVWSGLDYLGMLFGLVFAAAAISGAVWLRKHRFEI
jgi:hypothetical protein